MKTSLKILSGKLSGYIWLVLVSLIFFYPAIFFHKIPLPVDALVGAHVPWIETHWADYPAGVPIKNQEITDSISQFYPWRSLVAKFWREGNVPLWNSYMFSGAPFLATWHSASLYPLNVVYLFFSDGNAWTIFLYLQLLLSLCFTYLFLSYLGNTKIASICGSISFAFSGYMISWFEFATGPQAGLWLPLLLYFEFRLIREQKYIYLSLISAIFFMIFTAGDFQVPLYISVCYILCAIFLSIEKKESLRNILSRIVKPAIGLLLGLALASIQLIPTIELYQESIRISDTYIKEFNYGIFDWSKTVNFIWPDLFGNVATGNYWGRFGFHEYLSFSGLIVLLFSFYSIFTKKDKVAWVFMVLLIVGLLLAFPTPIAMIPYKLNIPGLGTSLASRVIYLVNFCLAVLGARGISLFMENVKDKKITKVCFYFLVVTAGILIGFLMCYLYLYKYSNLGGSIPTFDRVKVAIKNMIPGTCVSITLFISICVIQTTKFYRVKFARNIFSLTLVFLTTAEMLYFSLKNTPFSPNIFLYPPTKTTDFLMGQKDVYRVAGPGIPLNYFLMYGIPSSEGYDSLYPIENARWYSLVNFGSPNNPSGRFGEITKFSSPLLSYAGIKYVVDYTKNPSNKIITDDGVLSDGLSSGNFKVVNTEGRVKVLENENALPKVFMTKDYMTFNDELQLENEILKGEVSQKIYLTESKFDPKFDKSTLKYDIRNYEEGFNKISFETSSNTSALLNLAESYNKGWKLLVDGKQAKIYKSNVIFMSALVSPGDHRINFYYYPDSFRIGKNISIFTLLIVLIIIIWSTKNSLNKIK